MEQHSQCYDTLKIADDQRSKPLRVIKWNIEHIRRCILQKGIVINTATKGQLLVLTAMHDLPKHKLHHMVIGSILKTRPSSELQDMRNIVNGMGPIVSGHMMDFVWLSKKGKPYHIYARRLCPNQRHPSLIHYLSPHVISVLALLSQLYLYQHIHTMVSLQLNRATLFTSRSIIFQ